MYVWRDTGHFSVPSDRFSCSLSGLPTHARAQLTQLHEQADISVTLHQFNTGNVPRLTDSSRVYSLNALFTVSPNADTPDPAFWPNRWALPALNAPSRP